LPQEHAYAGLILALVGLPLLWKRERRLLVGTVILFVTCVFYSINYDIHDIDSYFLLAYFCIALWAGCGLYLAGSWMKGKSPLMIWGRGALLLLPGLLVLFLHFDLLNKREHRMVEDYTMNMFSSLQPGALVFSYQWDYWVSASYYYQLVKGVRPDLVVVDKELLRRSWYLKQLESRYPWLIQGSQEEVEGFLREVGKFERDLPYNPAVIQGKYVGMITSFIEKSLPERPVYVTSEIEAEFTPGLRRVPEGLAWRLYRDTLFHPTDFPELVYRDFPRKGREEEMIRRLYSEALRSRGAYYWSHDRVEAERSLARARSFLQVNSSQTR
jgi:hypothetical protein